MLGRIEDLHEIALDDGGTDAGQRADQDQNSTAKRAS